MSALIVLTCQHFSTRSGPCRQQTSPLSNCTVENVRTIAHANGWSVGTEHGDVCPEHARARGLR